MTESYLNKEGQMLIGALSINAMKQPMQVKEDKALYGKRDQ